ncbi:diguanylate cyclase (GGDEF) domain-containing protein [Frankineae bacterium MT45]|nr:diguanylate cyclase (GGDEF) domain-containing protein [Frankineae bacterium MT45]
MSIYGGRALIQGAPSTSSAPKSAVSQSAQRTWALATRSPAVGSHRLFALFTGSAYILAGSIGALSLVLGSSSPSTLWIEWLLAVCCVVGGYLVVRLGHHFKLGGFQDQILIFGGTVLVTLSVRYIGRPGATVDTSYLYLLPAVGCASFFPWVKALPQVLFIEVCACFAFHRAGLPMSDVVIQHGILFTMACTVAWLARAAAAAERDSLTGLANRRKFDSRLSENITQAQRNHQVLSVVLLDLDDFKAVNDIHGHGEGDRLLCSVSSAWRQIVSSGQLLCRQGGDEFALILPGYSANQAAALGDRLRQAVQSEIGCSVGVAELREGDSRTKLLGRADLALYDSKNRGGGRTSQHGVDVSDGVAEEIYRALADDEFAVHFQPVIDLRTGAVIGDEALVRWNHPERGMVPPDRFIPEAEKSGAIHALGAWVLEQACTVTAAHVGLMEQPRSIAVNASGHELRNPQYAENVADTLARTGLPAQYLTIEVTESTFDADYPEVIETLNKLRELGAEIAIDDFGTGYSSLSRLDNLPATILKIDQSFVASIAGGGKRLTVLKTIVALADALELTIIAEGVETVDQAQTLEQLGCGHAQGYYFGRPLAEQKVEPVGLLDSWHAHAA